MIFINSRDRVNPTITTGTNFTYNRSAPIETYEDEKLWLKNVNIPMTIMNVDSNANTIVVTISGTPYTLTLPSNYYSISTLATQLATTLSTTGHTFTVTYSAMSIFTFSTDTDFSISFPQAALAEIIGFYANVSYTSTSSSLTAPFTANMICRTTVIYIQVSINNVSCRNSRLITSSTNNWATFALMNSTVYGGELVYNDPTDTSQQKIDLPNIGIRTFSQFQISIFDSYGFPLNLNGANWSMSLTIRK